MSSSTQPQEPKKKTGGWQKLQDHSGDTTDYDKLERTWTEDIERKDIETAASGVVSQDHEILPSSNEGSASAWDTFFAANQQGYQDRRYIEREWGHFKAEQLPSWVKRQESVKNGTCTWMKDGGDGADEVCCDPTRVIVLEAGCGVGNVLFPLSDLRPDFVFVGVDISGVAVNIMMDKAKETNRLDRIISFGVVNLATEPVPKSLLPPGGVDAATMIFTLGALDPAHHEAALRRVFDCLAPGGLLFFRDHGEYDVVQLKHAKRGGNKLGERFYKRSDDGTLAYYFQKEEVEDLMKRVGFEILENDYVVREQYNRKRRMKWQHVWVSGHYKKPV